ncbi:MAG: response regulator [Planctomycetota bacterium]
MTIAKILLAEDDEALRHELGRFLQSNGYRVICVEDGYQALDFAVRQKPDLLILDVHMPAGDGFDVHDRVSKHPELTVTPTIYMTRDPSWQIEAEAREHGGFTLLHKPFDPEMLLEAVRDALGSAGSRAA